MWPTTIYTADGKTFDAEIADPVTKRAIRPEITTVLDVVTRKIVGIALSRSENQKAVAEALRNSCCGSGIPAVFYVDRGPGYRNKAMDADVGGLMGRLGITKMHAAPYDSQAKGRIERPNATVWDTLAKRLPTYIGKDRDKEAGDKVHKITRKQLKEFGESRLLPSWEDFVRLCEAMVAEYNDLPHRGLPKFQDPDTGKTRHMTPNECWAAHVSNGFEAVEVDPGEADDLFRPYEIRTARRAQVQWNGNFYFDQDLEAYHEEKVMVGYDYHQADKVWVREFDAESGQPGRLICVARFGGNSERYIPLSYEQKSIEDRAKVGCAASTTSASKSKPSATGFCRSRPSATRSPISSTCHQSNPKRSRPLPRSNSPHPSRAVRFSPRMRNWPRGRWRTRTTFRRTRSRFCGNA
ncbi:Mu transposase C-terminal domain-containing protein [Paracoccus cavernae]|uniref:Mu transposase C-terminal domain-containing protein n=1 Tax=Paracoccus cavernae TaxID=1571207 RepID=UPI0036414A80